LKPFDLPEIEADDLKVALWLGRKLVFFSKELPVKVEPCNQQKRGLTPDRINILGTTHFRTP
jgi:hypothetical protein